MRDFRLLHQAFVEAAAQFPEHTAIVEPAQVKNAMHDVQRELSRWLDVALSSHLASALDADEDLAVRPRSFAEIEAQDIGG